jgi:prepilin-type N-terminal cleavage/methylation domain-containing protein/prepilin-type processing-associated H-X9-DG protein
VKQALPIVNKTVGEIFPDLPPEKIVAWTTHRFKGTWRNGIQVKANRSNGFTLVELMVVVAVIGILAALLVPAVVKGKSAVKRIQCINSEKQFGAAFSMYASDNNDRIVANGHNNPPRTNTKTWVQGAFVSVPQIDVEAYVIDPSYALFARYIPTIKTYHCAADFEILKWRKYTYRRTRSYAMNSYLGWEGDYEEHLLPEDFRIFHKTCDLTAPPAGIYAFTDVQSDSICWPYFGVHMGKQSFYNFPMSRHNDSGVISYTDGHVETHRWRDPRTIQAISDDYHRHDDPSFGNPDVKWWQERTTVPNQ